MRSGRHIRGSRTCVKNNTKVSKFYKNLRNRGKSAHIAVVCNLNLFILEEPTIGLHPKDVEVLLKNLRQLQRKGANIVVIEHDIDVIQQSDYIIEMGEKGPESC